MTAAAKPSHIAAARLRRKISKRLNEPVPDWMDRLAEEAPAAGSGTESAEPDLKLQTETENVVLTAELLTAEISADQPAKVSAEVVKSLQAEVRELRRELDAVGRVPRHTVLGPSRVATEHSPALDLMSFFAHLEREDDLRTHKPWVTTYPLSESHLPDLLQRQAGRAEPELAYLRFLNFTRQELKTLRSPSATDVDVRVALTSMRMLRRAVELGIPDVAPYLIVIVEAKRALGD